MENNYKTLTKYEKLAQIQYLGLIKKERPYVTKYLKALWLNSIEAIAKYESFGSSARQILMNKQEYDQHLLFVFTDIAFHEYGWLERSQFLDVEYFEFPHWDGWVVMNHITIGRGINGKWQYGVNYSCNTSRGGYGLGVWGKIFDDRKSCLISVLQELIDKLNEVDQDKYTARVLKQAKDFFDTITGGNSDKQAPLFLFEMAPCS